MSIILNIRSLLARFAVVLVMLVCASSCSPLRGANNYNKLYSNMLESYEHAMFDYFRNDYQSAIRYFNAYLDTYARLKRHNVSELDYMDHENAVLASCRAVVCLQRLGRHRDVEKRLDGTLKALKDLMVSEQAALEN